MDELLTLQFDGGSRGNPGPAGIGIVISAADGTPLVTLGRFIGRATNNVAEYRALICALEQAIKLEAKRIIIRGDSELIIRQMRGEYRVKNPELRVLFDQAQRLLLRFDETRIEHNLRHHNELADKLANLAMDHRADVTDVDNLVLPSTESSEAAKVGDLLSCPRCGLAVEVHKAGSVQDKPPAPIRCECGTNLLLDHE